MLKIYLLWTKIYLVQKLQKYIGPVLYSVKGVDVDDFNLPKATLLISLEVGADGPSDIDGLKEIADKNDKRDVFDAFVAGPLRLNCHNILQKNLGKVQRD